MNNGDFGQLVAALRREHRDGDADAKGWTQERLGREAGLSMRVVNDIETGKKQKLDRDTLLRLAQALRLTSRERKEFFYAAVGIEGPAAVWVREDPQVALTRQIEIMREMRVPVFLVDVYGDLLAANGAMAELFAVTPADISHARGQPAGFSLMRMIFDQQLRFRDTVGADWPRYVRHNIHFFRAMSLRYRHKTAFQANFAALSRLPDFLTYWNNALHDQDDHFSTSLIYGYEHPRFGTLSYCTASSLILTGSGELSLTVYLPTSTATASTFARLVRERDLVLRLAPWPKEG